jgi:glycosyltransferase involved in cell wall biosynthesis
MSTIFVQIASFRDPQLNPTLQDMISKAKYPENLRIGICNQFSTEDRFNLDHYRNDDRFRIIDVIDKDSLGVCWARNQVQQLYSGETYTLQIDSHMRFEQDWDEILINMLKDLQSKGYPKPLLTGYVSSFDPENDPDGRVNEPWRMTFDRFIPEGAVFFLPEVIPGWQELTEPITARFYSAHFCFTLGEFSIEVQHDPEYYFHGEEISVGVRAYTHGYDLFHPHRVIIWHATMREERSGMLVWDDQHKRGESMWHKQQDIGRSRIRQLIGVEDGGHDLTGYDVGKVRTVRDYEKYAGIHFKKKSFQKHTIDNKFPPNPQFETEEEWENSFVRSYYYLVTVNRHDLHANDYDSILIAYDDENGVGIYSKIINGHDLQKFLNNDGPIHYEEMFLTDVEPSRVVYWAHSPERGWAERVEIKLK